MARHLAAAAIAFVAAPSAQAQTSRDIFKGKVTEGLYEVRTEADLTGVPGIPKEGQKSTDTKRRCVAKQEVEKGVEAGRDCQVKSYKESRGSANLVMECKDGTATDMKFTFAPGTFSSEMRTTGKQDGRAFVSVFRSQAKHVGPCLAAPAPAPPAAKK